VILILWPQSVTFFLDKAITVDPSTINIDIPLPDALPPLNFK
jgi:hypothetical protein